MMKFITKKCLFVLMLLSSMGAAAQGAHSLKINEVVVENDSDGIVDEFGDRSAWIEIANLSYGTANLRNCFLTNDPRVLDKNLSAPERIALMSVIRPGDTDTELKAKGMLLFFADGKTHHGVRHLNFKLQGGKSNFIALYDGNGVTLLDSVTVPAGLSAGQSYARLTGEDGQLMGWRIMQPSEVTPANENFSATQTDNKVREWKEKDPYGISMTLLAMGIVFFCLFLLFVFFSLFGIYAKRWSRTTTKEEPVGNPTLENQPNNLNEEQMEDIMAVIAMAIHESQNSHDVESDKITIVAHPTDWNRRSFNNF